MHWECMIQYQYQSSAHNPFSSYCDSKTVELFDQPYFSEQGTVRREREEQVLMYWVLKLNVCGFFFFLQPVSFVLYV